MPKEKRQVTARRRTYLKYVGSVTTGVGVAGCSSFGSDGGNSSDDTTSTNETSDTEEVGRTHQFEDRFERVVDLADAGADLSGEEPINQYITEYIADDTLFYFQAGTYFIDDLLRIQDYSNLGFVGNNATLRPADGAVGDWIIISQVADLLFSGFTIDNTAESTGVRLQVLVADGVNVLNNIQVQGFHDIVHKSHAFILQVNGTETELNLRNIDMRDGSLTGTAIFVHPSQLPGTLRFENCSIEDWYEQGLYASAHGGPLYIVGGRYANNGTAQVRVGGGDSNTPAVVRDVTVRVTDPEPADIKSNIRGIWLREGNGTIVDNCDIRISSLSEFGSAGALVIGPNHGRATLKNTNIQVDAQTFAITAVSPNETVEEFSAPSLVRPPENWEVRGENLTICGTANDSFAIWVVDRPGCEFVTVDIDQDGESRNGMALYQSPNSRIEQFSCVTPNYPLIASFGSEDEECDLTIQDISKLDHQIDDMNAQATTIPLEDTRYCVHRSQFDSEHDHSHFAVIDENEDELYVTLLSKESFIPY